MFQSFWPRLRGFILPATGSTSRRWRSSLLVVSFSLALTACGGAQTPAPSPTSLPAAVDTATPLPPPTQTPTALPTPTQTPTAPPVPTQTPTALPTPTQTPTALPAPTQTPTAPPQPTKTATPAVRPPAVIGQLNGLNLSLSPVIIGLNKPVFVTHAGDGSGRLFIVEKRGVIRIWQGGRLLETPFLNIAARVGSSSSEQGLLGLAFAPDFASSRLFFVNYTNREGDTIVERYRVTDDLDRADPASAFLILRIDQPAPNHNGGMIAFGADGYLWIGTGDGGGAGDVYQNGQNPQSLLGKMLRLDVTSDLTQPYQVPADNPWVGKTWNGQQMAPAVWALGLRNPWRFSFDRATGDLWIGDVGQGDYEEVDLAPAEQKGYPDGGLNFGWPIMEGTHCYGSEAGCNRESLTLPVAEIDHNAGDCALTGGYVYRGASIPDLDGSYFFGDYCSGNIWALVTANGRVQAPVRVFASDINISSFGEDEKGELYVVDLGRGAIYELIKVLLL